MLVVGGGGIAGLQRGGAGRAGDWLDEWPGCLAKAPMLLSRLTKQAEAACLLFGWLKWGPYQLRLQSFAIEEGAHFPAVCQ